MISQEDFEAEILNTPFITAEILEKAYKNMNNNDKETLIYIITRTLFSVAETSTKIEEKR